ncbi:MAG TPA: hypothetical protein DEG43_03675 [Acidimicrobiaceae bacterium]|nr:hypothetical protein [Acidimicrobiaceae bacterium]
MTSISGYCRTSTEDQAYGIEVQRTAILARYPDATMTIEHASGKDRAGRPKFETVLKNVCRTGGTLVVTKIDRLSRAVSDVAEIVRCIEQCGGTLHVLELGEPTGTPHAELTRNMLASVGQMERRLISERTKAGLAVAKSKGVKLGGARVPGRRADGTPTGKTPRPAGRKPSKHLDPRRIAVNRAIDAGLTASQVLATVDGTTTAFVAKVRRERQAAADLRSA